MAGRTIQDSDDEDHVDGDFSRKGAMNATSLELPNSQSIKLQHSGEPSTASTGMAKTDSGY